MIRHAVIASVVAVALVGCSSDESEEPPTPEPGELVEIDGPAQVDEGGDADPDD